MNSVMALRLTEAAEVSEDGLEPRLITPTFMEGLKNVRELVGAEAVEMRHNRIQLVDHILFFDRIDGPPFDANCISPFGEPLVGSCEAAAKNNGPTTKRVVARGPRKRQLVE